MSATTTIRLPEELKARIASAAERAGKTTHSFIIDTLTEKADMEEQSASFHAEAEARLSRIVESGKTVAWSEVRAYLQGRLTGDARPRPLSKNKRT